MAKTKEVTIPMLRKVLQGRPLSNIELRLAIEFYTKLSKNLDAMSFVDGRYGFAAQNTRLELEQLKTFASHRKLKDFQ